MSNSSAAINDNAAKTPNSWKVGSVSNIPPHNPASKFPIKLVKNQQPINNDKNFLGASFDTNDRPIGDRHNSATVIIK